MVSCSSAAPLRESVSKDRASCSCKIPSPTCPPHPFQDSCSNFLIGDSVDRGASTAGDSHCQSVNPTRRNSHTHVSRARPWSRSIRSSRFDGGIA
ncbi:hypothetical protein BDW62DRAFT_169577 [Aspergillus aurantiobrunneus]